jgi:hypothetical protein
MSMGFQQCTRILFFLASSLLIGCVEYELQARRAEIRQTMPGFTIHLNLHIAEIRHAPFFSFSVDEKQSRKL